MLIVTAAAAAARRYSRSSSSDARISIVACLWTWSGQTRIRVRKIVRRSVIRGFEE